MSRIYHLQSALLAEGIAHGQNVSVSDAGFITGIEAGAPPPEAESIAGIVVPGMPNGHSHAFQRAMAGRAEHRTSASDSFWTWRQAMYALANRIEPDELRLVATQLYIEMLKAGYTSVAEFHYLHRAAGGGAYVRGNLLWEAIRGAAREAGIGLTLLPTLYQSGDFGARPLKAEQRRFALDTEVFLGAVESSVAGDTAAREAATPIRTGAAFHSLRAVPPDSLRAAVAGLRQVDPAMPLHIHIAEQLREVESCLEATGRRPIEWLLDTGLVDAHWCLVHCTHASVAELRGIAASGASVCVSISTEANLGDGFFDTVRFFKLTDRLCIGSDSQSSVNPAEELRWLEYQQRLKRRRRGVLASAAEPHVGTRLWRLAAHAGGRALGQPVGALAVGRRADWLVLDAGHPTMAGSGPDGALDHLVFAGGDAAIRDVMVAGRWVVRDRRHPLEEALRAPFAALLRRFAEPG